MNKNDKFTFDFFEGLLITYVPLYRRDYVEYSLNDYNGRPILKTNNAKSLYKYILKNKYIIQDIEERGKIAYLTVVESKKIKVPEGYFDEIYPDYFKLSINDLLDQGYTLRQIQQIMKGE